MINSHKDFSGNNSYGEWKIRTMDLKSKNIEILMGNETDDVNNELFKSFKVAYQEGLEKKNGEKQVCF